ncbi:hypothetical protein GH714_040189 [Hevea brasiliensis]|uniref:Uncharacterized protein n=1 Tax=Hevea brasiliensis TaxID=3981 RepID=A0A6A6LR70_HEVBR|nr:hypothetical protein GH714_040189 [Hevea brasiliensis]
MPFRTTMGGVAVFVGDTTGVGDGEVLKKNIIKEQDLGYCHAMNGRKEEAQDWVVANETRRREMSCLASDPMRSVVGKPLALARVTTLEKLRRHLGTNSKESGANLLRVESPVVGEAPRTRGGVHLLQEKDE